MDMKQLKTFLYVAELNERSNPPAMLGRME